MKGIGEKYLGHFFVASSSPHFFNKTNFELYLFNNNVLYQKCSVLKITALYQLESEKFMYLYRVKALKLEIFTTIFYHFIKLIVIAQEELQIKITSKIILELMMVNLIFNLTEFNSGIKSPYRSNRTLFIALKKNIKNYH